MDRQRLVAHRAHLSPRAAGSWGGSAGAPARIRALAWCVLSSAAFLPALAAPSAAERAAPSAQEDEDVSKRIAASLSVLRDRRAGAAARDGAIEALLALGARGAEALLDHLEPHLARERERLAREERRIRSRFERLAPRLVEDRLDRRARREVERLRAEVLGNARSAGLSKELIERSSDAAYAELTRLLVVTVNQVWDADEELFEAWAALLAGLEDEAHLLACFDRALALAAGGESRGPARRRPEGPALGADALVAALAASARLASPMTDRDREVLRANAALAAEIDAEEAAGILELNLRRVHLGLSAQRIDVRLCEAARSHSRDMVEHGFFSHDSPLPGRESPWKRAAAAGTSASAENIAAGAADGASVILQWWYSPGHHANMLGGQTHAGLGRHERHWTQLFGP